VENPHILDDPDPYRHEPFVTGVMAVIEARKAREAGQRDVAARALLAAASSRRLLASNLQQSAA
jgi:hypothetical protein